MKSSRQGLKCKKKSFLNYTAKYTEGKRLRLRNVPAAAIQMSEIKKSNKRPIATAALDGVCVSESNRAK
jgi:hypothetical protein